MLITDNQWLSAINIRDYCILVGVISSQDSSESDLLNNYMQVHMNNKMHDTRSKNQTSLVDSRGLSLKNLSLKEGFVSDSHHFFNHWASLSVHK